jgi:hypothetical protein
LLAALNLIRAARPADTALAWLCLMAGFCWILVCLRFGLLIGNVFDFRVMIFLVLTAGLCAMCVRTLVGKR